MRSNHQYSEYDHWKKGRRKVEDWLFLLFLFLLFLVVVFVVCWLLVVLLYCGFVVLFSLFGQQQPKKEQH